jgi:hypothetical protein
MGSRLGRLDEGGIRNLIAILKIREARPAESSVKRRGTQDWLPLFNPLASAIDYAVIRFAYVASRFREELKSWQ